MYRRYYQQYDRFGHDLQRPIDENMGNPIEHLDNSINENIETTAEPEIIVPEKPSHTEHSQITQTPKIPARRVSRPASAARKNSPFNLFGKLGKDDLLLLALIFIVLQEGIDDDFLLLILIFLFFVGL
ncbi:MAG: hypothetical protein AB7G87_03555 [Clostridia bacterium]